MSDIKTTQEETLDGTVVYTLPLPQDLKDLDKMAPIVIKQPYAINYLHSYGQDSPFFAGLSNKKLLGTRCKDCGHTYATPKLACQECGGDCEWIELPNEGRIHSFTVCHFGSEEFLPECPYILALIEFEGVDSLFLSRLMGVDPDNPGMDWVGMKVKPKFKRLSKLKPTDVWFIPA
ncbi:MAG: Zn-ribbon domain-containing OB-fold protein [Deltaproteobacteria bacterium]|nr:Zn-ribbon domain-containing OB-fold protein [Deltaproteobacteria bacterium]